jgi:hypothetical protein
MGRSIHRGILLAAMTLVAVLALGSAAAQAGPYEFNAELSLTGGCQTSTVDPVADPGCPDKHPPQAFSNPRAITTDSYGNIYVVSYGGGTGTEGRIDIFDSKGVFITEVSDPAGPVMVSVDSKGNMYTFDVTPKTRELRRFTPTVYNPAAGEIEYGNPPTLITDQFGSSVAGIEINRSNDHLFVHYAKWISEYGSAEEGNKLLDDTIGQGVLSTDEGRSIAIDSSRSRIYASDQDPVSLVGLIRVFDLNAPHKLIETIDGASTPAGKLSPELSLTVDEETGHLFLYNGGEKGSKVVYELTEKGQYVSTISYGIKDIGRAIKIWVDNGKNSPNGGLNPDGRYLFVPSHPSGVGHVFAYGPSGEAPPEIEAASFSAVTDTEARLRGVINPGSLETSYAFEYTTQAAFEQEEFAGAVVAASGQLDAFDSGVPVVVPLSGLDPETAYRFRITATNAEGADEAEGAFTTYPAFASLAPCPNDATRTGLSALLPDCRAYELVTPADTNARSPVGVGHLGVYFGSPHTSPDGNRVSFQIEGGTIPGTESTGSFAGDPYLATRGPAGWTTASAGPDGSEAPKILPGSTSADQGYSFWSTANGEGSAAVDGKETHYVRYPDGHSELVGRGSLGTDPRADGKLITENGGHIIFVSGTASGPAIQLEPNAPSDGTRAIYDRTSDEVTHVVSLLPGDETPAAGQNASYVAASPDGEGVAFTIGTTLYLRHGNEETYEVGKELTFAGISAGGERVFYLSGGKLFAFDVEEGVIPFNAVGAVTPVNVSADGSAAYFVSTGVLTGEPNPNGQLPQAGQQNLYLSEEGAIAFVGIVTERDVEGEFNGTQQVEGLGLWIDAVGPGSAELPGELGIDPSRTTPDGSVLLFESRANLGGYDSEGHAQVYRYDSVAGQLDCLSCNPTGAPATGEASLQSISTGIAEPEPFGAFALVANLRADGRRAFFQSEEPLVLGDTDGLQDVYEWEDQGVGTCNRSGGCIYLISSGHSDRVDYLYAVSESGDDVFFRTSDLLLPIDTDETPSIYDARVGGGFPEGKAGSCEGEGCRPTLSPPPNLTSPNTPPLPSPPAKPRVRKCPKGKHKVKRQGKVRCVKNQRKRGHRKAGSTQNGGRK